MNWKQWGLGLLHAAIAGGVNAIAAIIVDPANFNVAHPVALSKMAGAGAVIGVVYYLKQSPLPAKWDGVDRRGP